MAHRPIQFGPVDEGGGPGKAGDGLPEEANVPGAASVPGAGVSGGLMGESVDPADATVRPVELDLKKDEALTVRWDDGRVSVYPVRYLRWHSPSAESKALREEMAQNPLAVLPSSGGSSGEPPPLQATGAELVGNYALRVEFSDGHRTGLYTWPYLRQIDPTRLADGP